MTPLSTIHQRSYAAPMETRTAIIGLGRAGRSLFLTLKEKGVEVSACYARNTSSLGEVFLANTYQEMGPFIEQLKSENVDILFIAVSDESIEEVAKVICEFDWLPPIVAHLSGSLSPNILKDVSKISSIGQFHPLVSMIGTQAIPADTFVGISASDELAAKELTNLALSLGLSPHTLNDGTQPLYHLAAIFTGNLVAALASDSLELMALSGIEEAPARKALATLLTSFAQSLAKQPLNRAATGPLARGEVQTIKSHLHNLQCHQLTNMKYRYAQLSLALLDKLDLPEKKRSVLSDLFKSS